MEERQLFDAFAGLVGWAKVLVTGVCSGFYRWYWHFCNIAGGRPDLNDGFADVRGKLLKVERTVEIYAWVIQRFVVASQQVGAIFFFFSPRAPGSPSPLGSVWRTITTLMVWQKVWLI